MCAHVGVCICVSVCTRTSLDCSPWKSPSTWEESQGEPEDFPDPEPRVWPVWHPHQLGALKEWEGERKQKGRGKLVISVKIFHL